MEKRHAQKQRRFILNCGLILPFLMCLILTPFSYARSLDEIKTSGELRICVAEIVHFVKVSPPGCKSDCVLESPHVELAKIFKGQLDRKLKKKLKLKNKVLENIDAFFFNDESVFEIGSNEVPKYLKNGECDFYPESLGRNPGRENKVKFLIFNAGKMIIVTNKKKGLSSPLLKEADLAGKSAIIEKGSIYENWINERNKTVFSKNPIRKEFVMAMEEKLALLNEGKYDFTILDIGTGLQVAGTMNSRYKNIEVSFPVGEMSYGGWAFQKGDEDLFAEGKKFIEAQTRNSNSEMNRIWKKYFGLSHADYMNIVTGVSSHEK